MKFTITLLSFLTVSAFAVTPNRIDLEPGATATIHADQDTTVSCKVGTTPEFKATYLVPNGTEFFKVAATCDKVVTDGTVGTGVQYARAISVFICRDTRFFVLENKQGLIGAYREGDLVKLF